MTTTFHHFTTNSVHSPCSGDGSCDQRSVWDIVWSCLVTIFACTWIAVHPNIPAASDTYFFITLRRMAIMLFTLIAPEIIILVAMRQWFNARKIGQMQAGKGWTTTHGFFIQMGGFMLYEDDKATEPIQLDQMQALYAEGKIDWPTITEGEIQDRSKGDGLSKGLVLLQTSWFVVQCIARASQKLVITELELVTLAFAVLNFGTYLFWWDKPVDVRYPIPVHQKSGVVLPRGEGAGQAGQHEERNGGRPGPIDMITSALASPLTFAASLISRLFAPFQRFLARRVGLFRPYNNFEDRSTCLNIINKLLRLYQPAASLLGMLKNVVAPMSPIQPSTTGQGSRVASFYAARIDPESNISRLMSLASSLVGIVFGVIHLIAWSFQFPTLHERKIWRISSLIVTCAPLVVVSIWNFMYRPGGLLAMTNKSKTSPSQLHPTSPARTLVWNNIQEVYEDGQWLPQHNDISLSSPPLTLLDSPRSQIPHTPSTPTTTPSIFSILMEVVFRTLLILTTFVYFIARCTLLVQALVALRRLSPGALQTIEWVSLIPHF